ncbi:MAG: putative major pilin subunit [Firmicutes bacterium ADurb.Bin193]|nr:MAG: putative major pilin subunit [Firmicutes bacterium ADurb.Bin193]
MLKMFRSKKGFSLVELIVVIAILGVISAIAIPSALNILKDSKVKADIATAQSIVKSMNLAVVSANSDTNPDNNIEPIGPIDLNELDDGDQLTIELKKAFPNIQEMTTQSGNSQFSIQIVNLDDFEGNVTFAFDGTQYTIDQTGKMTSAPVGEGGEGGES